MPLDEQSCVDRQHAMLLMPVRSRAEQSVQSVFCQPKERAAIENQVPLLRCNSVETTRQTFIIHRLLVANDCTAVNWMVNRHAFRPVRGFQGRSLLSIHLEEVE